MGKHVWLVAMMWMGCGSLESADEDEAEAYVGTTMLIPGDGACAHIVVTRLSDFRVSEYRGLLTGGSFGVAAGDSRVTATAYPEPCSVEPAVAPWIADPQLVTFGGGTNLLMLSFRRNASVDLDPIFEDETGGLVLETGRTRLGRSGEDAAAPGYALDGWNVTQLGLPPGPVGETVLFSTQGQGDLPYSPRGLARLSDGRFVVQVGELAQPLRVFGPTGTLLASWPVTPGAIRWDFLDGLEAIDDTHLVRIGWVSTAACDATRCANTGLEILELAGASLVVTQQILLPAPLGLETPVGVAPIGLGRFMVTTLPDAFSSTLAVVDGTGAIVAGPTTVGRGVEGLFVADGGRVGALDYEGGFRAYELDTTPRPETAQYPAALGISHANQLAWNRTEGTYLALSTSQLRVSRIAADLSSAEDLPIDLRSGYFQPLGFDYDADAQQVLIADRIPPVDPVTGTRIPAVDAYRASDGELVGRTTLQGVSFPARPVGLASLPGRIATHYRRPGAPIDPLDGVVHIHHLDGTLARTFDLAPYGFARIIAINYAAATDELLLTARDAAGTLRLIVTSVDGQPRRSYRLDELTGYADLAPITSGADAGQLGVLFGQPAEVARISVSP